MAITPTMEQMAIAVLRGDEAAALALADLLGEAHREGGIRLPPIRKIVAGTGCLKVVAFVRDGIETPSQEAMARVTDRLQRWMAGGDSRLVLHGIERIEIYEFPPPEEPG
jgi:hypothetical protein